MMTIIACVDRNWGIGCNGDLLFDIPQDMEHFKKQTAGKTVVMGRRTFDSLRVRPLPNRRNIVLTKTGPLNLTELRSLTASASFLHLPKMKSVKCLLSAAHRSTPDC